MAEAIIDKGRNTRRRVLTANLTRTFDGKPLAVVDNLPGGYAELRPEQLRALADALQRIADDCEARPTKGNGWASERRAYTLNIPPARPVTDAAGMPWDGRIHCRTKAFKANGTWRQRRCTSPALRARVEAELRQALGLPALCTPAPVPKPAGPNSVFGAAALAAGLAQPALLQ